MNVEAAALRWADTLRKAWPAGEIDAFVALYSERALFRGPFGDAELATEHMRRALVQGDPAPSVWVGEPLVVGDRAAVEWWAIITTDGEAKSFAATAWLRFDGDGAVLEEHDYWQAAPGHREPWSDWGR
jgi:hypothetical protein